MDRLFEDFGFEKAFRKNHPEGWHPNASKFETRPRDDRETLLREGDDLRKLINGRRILNG